MLLNPLSLNFIIWLPANFFYNEVVKLWKPIFKRLYLPYVTIEDMFNALISSVSFPGISTTLANLGLLNYQLTKRGGKLVDQTMDKSLTLTVKLSESYMTWMIARQLMDLYYRFGEGLKDLYFPPINITILDEGGFENLTYTYYLITPNSLSDFDLSYAAKPGLFNTFTWGFKYNYFEIYYRNEDGSRKKLGIDSDFGMLQDPGIININQNSIKPLR